MTEAFHRLRLIWLLAMGLFALTTGGFATWARYDGENGSSLAAKGGGRAGQEIVGTGHNAVRPTQMEIHPDIVDNYVGQLKGGGSVKPIDVTELPDGTRYITDGHHRYVAGQKAGVEVPMNVTPNPGPRGLPDWSETFYERFTPE